TPPELIEWLRESGLWARGGMMNFRQLTKIDDPAPIVLLLNDGNAALVVGRDTETNTVLLRDPRGQMSDLPMPIDELRLKQVWSGAVLLIRASRAAAEEDQPFNLAMLGRLVWIEKKTLGDIAISSVTLTILGIVPILMIMGSLNAALQYHSLNTLELVIFVVIIALIFEMILTWSRKMMEISVGSRLDAKLNL
ncbi:MAG TPA: peptidase domain-containing ABC transporter, partial [Acidocella sp.]|nr:peptidase domain-containing ABC transporter [Acidocella sp.]